MSTVPLPMPTHPSHTLGPLWSEDQMLAYGEACAAEAREEMRTGQEQQMHTCPGCNMEYVDEAMHSVNLANKRLRAENEALRTASERAMADNFSLAVERNDLRVEVEALRSALLGLLNNSTRADWPDDLYDAAEKAAMAK